MRLNITRQKDLLTKDNGLMTQGYIKMTSRDQKDLVTKDNGLMMQGCVKQMSRGQVELHSGVSKLRDKPVGDMGDRYIIAY